MARETGHQILLTGGSGVIGHALLERLPPDRVICLVRRRPVDRPGVETVAGDAVEPRLGLAQREFDELARRVDTVIHAAAITEFFTATPAMIESQNVRGTERALDFASAAGAPLYYISTAFVNEGKPDEAEDRPVGTGIAAAAASYRRSKEISEQRVRASGLNHVIVRPSVLFGDSRTGSISAFQGIHATLRAMLQGEVPAIPVSPEGRLDLVPQDVVADAIAGLVELGRREGLFWLTLGDRALTVRRVAELCVETAGRYGMQVQIPDFVGPQLLEQLMKPEFMDQLPTEMRKRVERQLAVLAVAGPREALPSSLGELEDLGVMQIPDSETAFVNGLVYWARRTGIIDDAVAARSS
jgi:nucleoside-diphosphate-sugar epimerase